MPLLQELLPELLNDDFMKLSIITINYNNAAGLRQTFDSISKQSCRDFEYVVVDGNSNDGSKDIIKEYQKCIDKWVSEPDAGIYNAMNKGARMSSGEYMLFLNSGDFLHNDDVVGRLLNESFDEDIVCCSMFSFGDKTSHLCIPPKNVSLYTFIGGGSMLHPSTLIKRSIFDKVGGYIEDYKIISDWCFFIDSMIVHNCTYRVLEHIVLTSFNQFGISSKNDGDRRKTAQREFMNKRFPRIIDDYIPLKDEALSNCAIYISDINGKLKYFLSMPFKIFNSIMKLRVKLSKRTVIENAANARCVNG